MFILSCAFAFFPSVRRTLKGGLSDELVQALGLAQPAGLAV